ncbi:MFS transporter [Bowmanella denitrificans]|uniref:MFS transporter n=1 Tax=Bowmanella denitrificans TaxID=366582 RepID=A0ABN0X8R0_9ALTE
MSLSYLALFKAPGSSAFTLAGLLARLPLSMMGIGLITMLSQLYDSYWLAGAVAATFTFSMAVLSVQISKWVDRLGQSRVLPLVTAVSVLSVLLLLVVSMYKGPVWLLFVLAATGGAMPSMPAMIRARWTEIYRNTPQLQTAYALESVLDELSFIIGPPLAVGLSVLAFPQAGPLLAAALLALGVMAFIWQKRTEPAIYPPVVKRQSSILMARGMPALILVLLALGVIVGSIDVISVAFAEQLGKPAAASLVLSAYAVGSCLAGLTFGALRLKMSLPAQLVLASLATLLSALPFLWVGQIYQLSLAVFVAGLFFAPAMILAMTMVERLLDPARLTEGLTWLITGLSIGVATGAALAGWVVDSLGTAQGFMLCVAAAGTALLVALCNYAALTKATQPMTAEHLLS